MSTGLIDRLTVVEKIIATIAAAGLAFTTLSANRIQNALSAQKVDIDKQQSQLDAIEKRQQIELQGRKDAREANQQQSDLTHKIFQEFVTAITDKDTATESRLDRLEGILVLTYAISDPRQQEGMARAVQQSIGRLNASPNASLAVRVSEASFDVEELLVSASAQLKDPPAPAPRAGAAAPDQSKVHWKNYDFDVFWCEGQAGSSELRKHAEAVTTFKSKDEQATGRWRTRPLPATINARPGYQIKGYQVRFSSPDEKPVAETLKSLMEKTLPSKGPVSIRQVSTQTPWYLSVFVCE